MIRAYAFVRLPGERYRNAPMKPVCRLFELRNNVDSAMHRHRAGSTQVKIRISPELGLTSGMMIADA